MTLKRFFLLGFVFSFAATALVAVGVILFGKWGKVEIRTLLTTVSIGVYSLIALSCSTIHENKRWAPLSTIGIFVCGVGLIFATLTNWEIIKPELRTLLKMRVFFLSLAMAIAATALMLRITSPMPA
jgi:hypothetical protein